MHGGSSPKGLAHPRTSHGRYSRELASLDIAQMYEEARSDEESRDLKEEIALVEARIRQLMTRLRAGEGREAWLRGSELMSQFRAANARGDVTRQVEVLQRLDSLLQTGVEDYSLWDEINAAIERRTRLIEAETRLTVQSGKAIPADKAYLLIHALLASVRQHVKDRHALSLIAEEFRRLTGDLHL